MQITSGIRKILSIPMVYNLFQWLLAGTRSRRYFMQHFVNVKPGDKLLDVGCGPAEILKFLPEDIHYTGVDLSAPYIETAKKRFGDRGTFLCQDVTSAAFDQTQSYDLILAVGLLHHLDDAAVLTLLKALSCLLSPGKKLVTFDCVYIEHQNPIAKWLISKDRGQNVRDVDGYVALAKQVFNQVDVTIKHDLLRLPYTHIILEMH